MTDLEMNAPVSQTEMKNELGKRPTKLTVKALQAKMMWQQKERNSRIKKLYKLTKEVEQIMKSNKRVSDGQEKYEMISKLSVEVTEINASLKPLMSEDEMSKENEWVETQMQRINEIKQTFQKWLFGAGH